MTYRSNASRTSWLSLFAATAATLGVIAACGSSTDRASFPDPDAGDGSGGLGPGLEEGGRGVSSKDACVKESTRAAQLPLDMYLMVDQSLSMQDLTSSGGSKWTAVTGALNTFLGQSSLAGVGVGIQYFGLPVGGKTCSTTCTSDTECPGDKCIAVAALGFSVCGQCLDSCTGSDYAKPEVEIAPLPGSLAALKASIAAHSPSTLTPTSAALEGAVGHAQEWAAKHTDHVTVAVFATDGDPSECDLDPTHINAVAAAAAAATPPVLTFVIGVGSSFTALDGIAKAGGTTSAFTVDTSGNVNQKFVDALNKIRGAALGCQYSLPVAKNGEILDLATVNLEYTPSGGKSRIVAKVKDKASCPAGGEGWYYDDNTTPTQILLCDSVCSTIGADVTGDLTVFVGCATIVK